SASSCCANPIARPNSCASCASPSFRKRKGPASRRSRPLRSSGMTGSSAAFAFLAPAAFHVLLAYHFGVGHGADDGTDLHLRVRLDGGLLGAAVFLTPDEGHFGAGLGILLVE